MDAFVTRKKRKRTPSPDDEESSENESTEVKLALLASVLEASVEQDVLLDVLLAHGGSVGAAAESLRSQSAAESRLARKRRRARSADGRTSGVIGQQTSLRAFATAASPEKKQQQQQTDASGSRPAARLSRRGRTLFLYDPADVETHTPCTLVHNFLPASMADDLLREMLGEAQTFQSPRFRLFEHVVASPHTSGFFVDGIDTTREDQDAYYLYNGARCTDVRASTPQLARVRPRVQEAVNAAVQQRIAARYPGGRKLRHQPPGPWRPNAAFVNCYRGGQETVGWHSDQLTYLGPRAIIGSLSLGVAREFRVRRVLPRDEKDEAGADADADDDTGQISIHLPHNSLLIMHAEMQEQWKHCVAAAASIDPHPVAGNTRINITYRDYRAALHPCHTPRCRCGIATVLRVVQKKKENYGRYFWMCHAGNIPDKKGCSYFQWAEFDDDGNPVWRHTPSRNDGTREGRSTA